MAQLAVVAAGAQLLGGIVGAAGQMQQGRAEKAAADAEAVQLEAKGKEEFAAAQRVSLEKRREGELASSRLQALAASSGAGADTPTIVGLMSGILSQADYNAKTATYGGAERRAGLFDAAGNRRRSGKASLLGAKYAAMGSIVDGISGAAGSFG